MKTQVVVMVWGVEEMQVVVNVRMTHHLAEKRDLSFCQQVMLQHY